MTGGTRQVNYRVLVRERLPESLAPSAARLDRESFDTGPLTDEQQAEIRDRFCSEGDIFRYVVAVQASEVVGMVIAYRRALANDGGSLVLGGIGSVCVAQQLRRRGIASQLIAVSMQALDEAACDAAYLCTDLQEPSMLALYGQFGFVPLGRPHTYTGASGRRYVDEDAMVAPVRSPEVFQALLSQTTPLDIGRGNW